MNLVAKNLNSYIYPILLIILSLGITLQNYFMGENHFWGDVAYTHYNNFIIFKDSFFHLVHQQNLYIVYTEEYADLYKYSPTFALFMGVFAFLPNWLGLFLWNLIGCGVLFFALNKLITDRKKLVLAFIFVLPELILTTQNSQSNALLAGFIILAFNALEKEKNNLAALFIVATVFIKLFTMVAFLLFLFYPNKLKSALHVFLWTLIFLFLPVLVTGLRGLEQQYFNWIELLKNDHSVSYGLSLAGFLNTLHLFEVNKTLTLLFGVLILLLPLLNYKKWSQLIYKQNYLCLILIWMVVFNHKAESPSYIITFAGCALWGYFNGLTKFRIAILILCFIFSSLICTDICPRDIRINLMEAYNIKVILPTVILLLVCADLFQAKAEQKITQIKNNLSE